MQLPFAPELRRSLRGRWLTEQRVHLIALGAALACLAAALLLWAAATWLIEPVVVIVTEELP